MAITIRTIYPTGRTLSATLERLSDGFLWDNTNEEWAESPDYADTQIALTEGVSPSLGSYTGSPAGDLEDAEWVRVVIRDDNLETAVGEAELYVDGNAELRSHAVDVADAVDAVLADDFAAIPAAVDAELTSEHGAGSWRSMLGDGADVVTLTLSSGGVALDAISVWITSDAAGTSVVAGPLSTDAQGQVDTLLTDGQAYYMWARATSGYNPIVGTEFAADVDNGNAFTMTAITTPGIGASIYDLLPDILPYLDDCPEPVVKAELRKAASEFLRDTEIWKETQTETLTEATATVSLSSDYSAITQRVNNIYAGTASGMSTVPLHGSLYEVTESETVVFGSEYAAGTIFEIEKAVFPTSLCTDYPAWIINRWGRAIVDGAFMSLYRLPAFRDAASAADRADSYARYIGRANLERHKERQDGVAVVSFNQLL